MGSKQQEFLDSIVSLMGEMYVKSLLNDREVLEDTAMEAVCACRHYDLADTIRETSDNDLLAIVMKSNPCEICVH